MSFIYQIALVSSVVLNVSYLSGVLIRADLFELPKDNRCILLSDRHEWDDARDGPQLKASLQALQERTRSSNRPLYILNEYMLDQFKPLYKNSVVCSLPDEVTALKLLNKDKAHSIMLEKIEIRQLVMVVHDILNEALNKELTYNNTYTWTRELVSFNDLLNDFEAHKQHIHDTFRSFFELCETEEEQQYSKDYCVATILQADALFADYVALLKKIGIEASSTKSIYQTVYCWNKRLRFKIIKTLVHCYSILFDYNALINIFRLHKQHSSSDIILIAGANHCFELRNRLETILNQPFSYYENTNKGVPARVLFDLFASTDSCASQGLLQKACTFLGETFSQVWKGIAG